MTANKKRSSRTRMSARTRRYISQRPGLTLKRVKGETILVPNRAKRRQDAALRIKNEQV